MATSAASWSSLGSRSRGMIRRDGEWTSRFDDLGCMHRPRVKGWKMKGWTYLFLSACSAGADADTAVEDVGTVTISCTYSYVTDGEVARGTYPGFTTDCDGWAETGSQSLGSKQSACEQAG